MQLDHALCVFDAPYELARSRERDVSLCEQGLAGTHPPESYGRRDAMVASTAGVVPDETTVHPRERFDGLACTLQTLAKGATSERSRAPRPFARSMPIEASRRTRWR
jgi:hypothetical protein